MTPCRCADAERTHDERGRCSAIPPCCRRWFADVWVGRFDWSVRQGIVRLQWGYVPCPGCRQCGARIQVRRCEEVCTAA